MYFSGKYLTLSSLYSHIKPMGIVSGYLNCLLFSQQLHFQYLWKRRNLVTSVSKSSGIWSSSIVEAPLCVLLQPQKMHRITLEKRTSVLNWFNAAGSVDIILAFAFKFSLARAPDCLDCFFALLKFRIFLSTKLKVRKEHLIKPEQCITNGCYYLILSTFHLSLYRSKH